MIALADRVRRQTEEVEALAEELDAEAFARRPAEGRWSVGEHVAHLTLTLRPYLPVLEGAVRTARERGWRGDGPSRGTWRGRTFLRTLAPPPKRRFKTFRKLEPPPDLDRTETLAAFRAAQDELAGLLDHAGDLDIGRTRVRSPFLWLLRMSGRQAAEAAIVHTDRHVWLMREALGEMGHGPEAGGDAGA